MQYFKPDGDFFVGDCMPFFHDGAFHLYYLLDEKHHRGKDGLGGHQWAHASSTDLQQWTHHPLALPVDEEWECSICTGSVFYHEGTYYAFYATRLRDWSEHLSLATSTDGITFEKTTPNPFASPPEGYSRHYRDPYVFQDDETGRFHMLVTAALANPTLPQSRGCLAHLMSEDLRKWDITEPFLVPGYKDPPECSDYFHWNGWYYLIFSNYSVASYRLSRNPYGPWIRPKVDTFDGRVARVLKSTSFTGNRRIGVTYLASRQDNKDDGRLLFAGNAGFRELVQHDDGSLGTKFPPEMIPAADHALQLPFEALTAGVTGNSTSVRIQAEEGFGAAMFTGVPADARITTHVRPQSPAAVFGLLLRGSGVYEKGYELWLLPDAQRVELHDQFISCVEGLTQPFSVDIIMKDDIIDVCIDQRRCLINRCPEQRGDRLVFFCHNGDVVFDAIEMRSLL